MRLWSWSINPQINSLIAQMSKDCAIYLLCLGHNFRCAYLITSALCSFLNVKPYEWQEPVDIPHWAGTVCLFAALWFLPFFVNDLLDLSSRTWGFSNWRTRFVDRDISYFCRYYLMFWMSDTDCTFIGQLTCFFEPSGLCKPFCTSTYFFPSWDFCLQRQSHSFLFWYWSSSNCLIS